MSKPKLMDFNTDWEVIKDTQLNFLLEDSQEASVGIDHRFASYDKNNSEAIASKAESSEVDRRETILKALVAVAAFN
ncbi:MAG: hypothetical protein ACOWWR_18170 [Eubacteriales bacterium]